MAAASSALKTFELENSIEATDAIYQYDNAEQQRVLSGRPWKEDPKYFKHVRISAIALVKMVMHARSGGSLEVMGLMQGKIDPSDPRGPTFIVMDAYALPVEGTETRVNAQADAYEYMVEFNTKSQEAGRKENVCGWYHSHLGYGCWLSGIDCATQMLNQQHLEPWLAIVVDPTRTATTGKVEIGAFRTYPQGYKPPDAAADEFESVPLGKIEDFGAHQNQYYPLEISYFKSASDTALLNSLWNKYWIGTLSSSPLLSNLPFMAAQIKDLAEKIEVAEGQLNHFGRGGGSYSGWPPTAAAAAAAAARRQEGGEPPEEDPEGLGQRLARARAGGMSQVLKSALRNPGGALDATSMDTA